MIGPGLALAGWIPYRIRADRGSPVVEWCFMGEATFTDPFFEQTIQHCLRKPSTERAPQETPIDALLDWRAAQPGIAPTAFIFHSSRCGSTLLSRMAAALPHTIAISEALPVDDVLRARVPEEMRIEWLRAVLSALGQPRRGNERHVFVKLDAWHVMDLPLVQQAFPDVPCLFLYRGPAAVVASQLRMPGLQMLPGTIDPAALGLDAAGVAQLDREERCGRVLAAIYAAGLAHAAAGRVALMNYAQLPDAASRQLLAWCGLDGRDDIRAQIHAVAQFDAKTPCLPFDRADLSTRPLPGRREVDTAARFVDACYAKLESIRLGGG